MKDNLQHDVQDKKVGHHDGTQITDLHCPFIH
jgi:hypothetical protein